MSQKKFNVMFILTVEDDNNILSSFEDAHEDDVFDLITDTMYDIDDVKIENLVVKERL